MESLERRQFLSLLLRGFNVRGSAVKGDDYFFKRKLQLVDGFILSYDEAKLIHDVKKNDSRRVRFA